MTAAALIALWTVLGGCWRRILGGWLGLPRSICYALMAPLMAPVVIFLAQTTWPLWVACLAAIVVTTACLLFFVVSFYPGGKFTDDRDVLLKYGPFGLGYVLAHRFWRDEWNTGSLIDGSNSVGEILLGASFWGSVGLLFLL
jgi:hypothetical protein